MSGILRPIACFLQTEVYGVIFQKNSEKEPWKNFLKKMYLQEVIVEIMRSTTRNEADGMTFIIHTLHGWMAGRYLFVQFMTVQKKNYIRRKLNSRPTQIS